MANPIARKTESVTATILNGASLSAAVDMGGRALVGILMPAAWTAAGITLQGSADGTTYADVYIAAGTEYALVVAASRFIILDPTLFRGFTFIKVRSGATGLPVVQLADRAVVLITAEL